MAAEHVHAEQECVPDQHVRRRQGQQRRGRVGLGDHAVARRQPVLRLQVQAMHAHFCLPLQLLFGR